MSPGPSEQQQDPPRDATTRHGSNLAEANFDPISQSQGGTSNRSELLKEFSSELKARFFLNRQGLKLFKHPTGINVLCRSLEQLDIGGKAEGIVALARDGFTIPKTLLISRDLLTKPPAVQSNLNAVKDEADPEMDKLYRTIRRAAHAAGIHDWVAIRSSGFEDMEGHTAAGVFYSTFVSLEESALKEGLLSVTLSAYSGHGQNFCLEHKLPVRPIPVVLQELASAGNNFYQGMGPSISGIADSSYPGKVLVVFAPGLGNTLASGKKAFLATIDLETRQVSILGDCPEYQLLETSNYRGRIEWHSGNGSLLKNLVVNSDPKLKELMLKIGLDADAMKRTGLGVDLEFAVESDRDISKGKVVYLQRRYTSALSSEFELPFVKKSDCLAWTNCSLGQGSITASHLIEFSPVQDYDFTSPRWQALLKTLREFDQKHPEGYIYLVHNSGDRGNCKFTEDELKDVLAGTYTNAKAIVITRPTYYPHHENAHVALSHFGQYYRSEKIPLLVIGLRDLKESFAEELEKGTIFTKSGCRSIALARPWIVACDQRIGHGFLALKPE